MTNINKYDKSKGFTLIELMIAISILTLLLFTGSYSYGLLSERWDKELGHFNAAATNSKNLELTQRLLEGIQSFVIVDDKKKPSFFFIGNEKSLLAVSQEGLFSGGSAEIFRLTVVETETGLFDLVYQSRSTKNFILKGTNQIVEFDKKLILFKGLVGISFEYFGWRHMFEKTDDEGRGFKPLWLNAYSGIESQYMPERIRLYLSKDNKTIVLPVSLQTDVESWLSPYFDRDT